MPESPESPATARGFARLVREMRLAQIHYFQARDRAALDDARFLERRVDKAVSGVLAGPSLFRDESEAALAQD